MFPKHKFHELIKPALELFRGLFGSQGDVHRYLRKCEESQVIFDTFEELKATVEDRFREFREKSADPIPEGQVEAAAERFKGYYDAIEKIGIILCEYEDGWYRQEMRRAMKTLAAKVKAMPW